MDLMAHRTRDRLIDMAVLGGVFGGKALNAVSGRRAAVYEERHAILNKSQLSRCSITDVYLVQCNSCRRIVPHFAFYARPDDAGKRAFSNSLRLSSPAPEMAEYIAIRGAGKTVTPDDRCARGGFSGRYSGA